MLEEEKHDVPRFSISNYGSLEGPSKSDPFSLPIENHPELNFLREKEKTWMTELTTLVRSKRVVQVVGIFIFLIVLRVGSNFLFRESLQNVVLSVHVTKPTKQAMDASLTLPGNMEAVEMASLFSHIAGYLKKIYVDEGDEVKQGQLLADIDAPDIIDEYNKVKSALDFKTVTRTRYKELLDDKVISEQEFDAVDSAYSEEKSRFEAAAANMGYTHIRAPFAGSIARRFKYPGDLISSAAKGDQSPIFLLVNESRLRVVINVPQSDLASVNIGSPVDIRVDTFPDMKFTGTVSRLDNLLEASTKTQRVLIDIENKDKKLHAGMFGSVILHFQHREDALTIPGMAVEAEGDKHFVFLVRDGKAKRTPVTVGATQGDRVEVVDGLKSDDIVILKGTTELNDGLEVQAVAGDTT